MCLCVSLCVSLYVNLYVLQAIDEIETNGGDAARVLLAMTDGIFVGNIFNRVRFA